MAKKRTAKTPRLRTSLYRYQRKAVRKASHFNGRILIADEMGLGKAQPISEPVLTPCGWREIGSIQPGDYVIGSDGMPTRVVAVNPQTNRSVLRVTFSDGSWTRCSPDHLWNVRTPLQKWKGKDYQTLSTKCIVRKGLHDPPRSGRKTGNRKWHIPITDKVEFKRKELPIHPYVLGVLLGDGHLSCGKYHCTSFTPGDKRVASLVEKFIPKECNLVERKPNKHRNHSLYNISAYKKGTNLVRNGLIQLGLADGIRSHKRFIPAIYMMGSAQQRLDLLSGLLDTDGYICNHHVSFSSVSKTLRDQVVELAESLGGIARKHQRRGNISKGPHAGLKRMSYSTTISLPEKIIATKAWEDRWVPKSKYQPTRSIESINDESDEDCVCIKVENEDGLYLTRHCIVTHNSLEALAWVVKTDNWPAVIVCPASLKINWQREIRQHFGSPSRVLSGMKPESNGRLAPLAPDHRFVILNYKIIGPWLPWLRSLDLKTVILDECHLVKNPKSKRTKNTKALCKGVPHVFALGGTPLTNRPAELFTVLKLLRPDVWSNFLDYAWKFTRPKRTFWGWTYKGARNLQRLNRELNQYVMIRRRKADVLHQLPEKTRTVVPLSIRKRPEYERAERDFLAWLRQRSKAKAERASKAKELSRTGYLKRLAARLKFRPVCEWIDSYLEETDGKLILFGIQKKMVRKLHERYPSLSVVVHGGVKQPDRMAAVDKFQADRRCRLFIGNLQAAGVGLNLQAAGAVAFAELGWTPAEHTQAEDRAHRIGQRKSINCYYLVAERTIETALCEIIQDKQTVFSAALDGSAEIDKIDVHDQLISSLKKGRR